MVDGAALADGDASTACTQAGSGSDAARRQHARRRRAVLRHLRDAPTASTWRSARSSRSSTPSCCASARHRRRRRFRRQIRSADAGRVLRERFADVFRTRTRDEWCALLEGSDACFAPVLTMRRGARRIRTCARAAPSSTWTASRSRRPRRASTRCRVDAARRRARCSARTRARFSPRPATLRARSSRCSIRARSSRRERSRRVNAPSPCRPAAAAGSLLGKTAGVLVLALSAIAAPTRTARADELCSTRRAAFTTSRSSPAAPATERVAASRRRDARPRRHPETFRLLLDDLPAKARLIVPRAPMPHGADGFSWFAFHADDEEGLAELGEGIRGRQRSRGAS